MSDDDLIRRGDALAAIQLGDTVTKLQARIAAIHAVDAEPVCTTCGGTGITYQTERRCACLGPDLSDAIAALAEQLAAARRDAEEAEAYAGELEQQLGKAVDALRAFNSFDDLPTEVKRPDIFEINVRLPILRALAELTGGKDE